MILSIDFCPISKILICFSLMKRFPNGHKRYSSHLPVSILHRVTSIKVYLTIYDSLRNSYLKISFRTINKSFWLTSNLNLYMKTTALRWKLVYSLINFIIPLPVTYVKHSWSNYRRVAKRFLNPFQSSVTFLYPLKKSQNLWFSDIFRGYRNVTLD